MVAPQAPPASNSALAEPPISSPPPRCAGVGGGVSLWREVQWLVHCGEAEAAYERVLIDGNDRDLLRLMGRTGICLTLLAPPTKALLFSCISRMIQSNVYIDQVLPWVLQSTQSGDALQLPKPVRRDLVKSLYRILTQNGHYVPAVKPPATTASLPSVMV